MCILQALGNLVVSDAVGCLSARLARQGTFFGLTRPVEGQEKVCTRHIFLTIDTLTANNLVLSRTLRG